MSRELIIQDLSTRQESKAGLIGRVWARLKPADQEKFITVWNKPIENKVVNKGLARMAYLLGSDSAKKFKCGAIGTGSTAATASDNALESQILTRVTASFSTETTAVTGDTGKWVISFTSDTNSYAVTEFMVCETQSGGDAMNRVTFAAITLNLNDVLEMTQTMQAQEGA
jgi:hypothetical protein